MLTFGTLFSGIEGFGLGFSRAGMRCLWQVENDPACNRVLERKWSGVKRYGDVRGVGGRELEPVELIAGGFPCQDVSLAGRRAGLAGERSGLWYEFHRILGEHRPRWVVIENVPGLLSSPPCEPGRDFAIVISGLVEIGYRCAWRVLDSQYFGLAQRRDRLFIVGNLRDGSAAKVLFESEGGGWHPEPSRKTRTRVAATITSGVGVTGNALGRRREDDVNLVCAPLRGNHYGDHAAAESHLVLSQNGSDIQMGKRLGTVTAGQARQLSGDLIVFDPTQITSPGNYSNPKADDPCHPITAAGQAPCVAFDWQAGGVEKDRQYIVRAGDYTGALRPHRQDALVHGMNVRRLTPIECERLQGFPDGYTAGESDSARYRMLGNAVYTTGAEWIGGRITALVRAMLEE